MRDETDDFELDGPGDPLRDPYKDLPPEEAARLREADEQRINAELWAEEQADQMAAGRVTLH